jgi:hypothetical protein
MVYMGVGGVGKKFFFLIGKYVLHLAGGWVDVFFYMMKGKEFVII